MNQERIRELAEQAVIAVDNPFPGNPLNDELEKMYIPDCFAEKFAELIVRECARRCMDIASEEALKIAEIDDGRDTFAASIATAGKIGRKIGLEFDLFGVEE